MGRLKLLHFGFGAPELFITSNVSIRSKGDGFQNTLRNIASHEGIPYLVSPQIGQLWKTMIMLKSNYLQQNKWINYKNLKNGHFNAYLNFNIQDWSTEEVDVWQECVGYPGIKLLVSRSQKIKINYQKQRKFVKIEQEIKGFASKVMQQAHDHLQAIDPLMKAKDIDIIDKQLKNQHYTRIKQHLNQFISQRQQIKATTPSQFESIYRRSKQFNHLRRELMYCITDHYHK